MTRTLVSVRRLASLSIAITLLAAPIASAQALDVAPPVTTRTAAPLINPTGFARLVQAPRSVVAPVPAVKSVPHINLRRLVTSAEPSRLGRTYAAAPRQGGWVSRNVGLTWLIIIGAIMGPLLIYAATTME